MEKKIRKKKGEEGRKIGLKVQQKKTYQTEFFFLWLGYCWKKCYKQPKWNN